MLAGGAVNVPGHLIPPSLAGEVGFGVQRKRPMLPGGVPEPPVLRQRMGARRAMRRTRRRASRQGGEPGRRKQRRIADLPLPRWRDSEVDRPVEPGLGKAHRRKPTRDLRNERVDRTVDRIL